MFAPSGDRTRDLITEAVVITTESYDRGFRLHPFLGRMNIQLKISTPLPRNEK